ncbi:hypothetical protein OpiT1DRAFT_01231 [Opitutaceae bacterium TAV1]|nr:hypothetical protein OpiT1DRAFT_01231 [Opitutaceae bacterium TAV1]
MPLIIEPISLESVAPGSDATHNLRCDRRYHQLRYRSFVNGVAVPVESVIDYIIVKVNRQERWNLSVPRTRLINSTNLFSDPIDTVTLHWAEPWQEGYEASTRTAWNLIGQQTCEVKIKIKPQAQGAVVAIEALMAYDFEQLVADANFERLFGVKAGTIIYPHIRKAVDSHALVDGTITIQDKNLRQNICRMFFFGLNADAEPLDRVIVRADDVLRWNTNRQEVKDIMADYGMNLLDSVPFVVPFDLNGRTEWLYAAKAMALEIHSPAAQTVDLLCENIHFGWN